MLKEKKIEGDFNIYISGMKYLLEDKLLIYGMTNTTYFENANKDNCDIFIGEIDLK